MGSIIDGELLLRLTGSAHRDEQYLGAPTTTGAATGIYLASSVVPTVGCAAPRKPANGVSLNVIHDQESMAQLVITKPEKELPMADDRSSGATARLVHGDCRSAVEIAVPIGSRFEDIVRNPDWLAEIFRNFRPRGSKPACPGVTSSSASGSTTSSTWSLVAELRLPVEVGIVYSGVLTELLAAEPDLVDVVSIIPEMFWHETSGTPRYRPIETAAAALAEVVAAKPVVLHGIGLSIGSGLPLDLEHLDQVASTADLVDARWFSEHLAAFRVGAPPGRPAHVGVGLPVPYDIATLRAIAPKVSTIVRRLGIPVLLENNALYVEVPFADMTEAGF